MLFVSLSTITPGCIKTEGDFRSTAVSASVNAVDGEELVVCLRLYNCGCFFIPIMDEEQCKEEGKGNK